MAITFQNQEIAFKLFKKTKIKQWIKIIIQGEKKKLGNVNFVFTTDEELLKINKQFLNHTTYTDIVTFDYCENLTINGDIIISIDRIKENAKKFKVDVEIEIRRVIIHGILHLCGYKDKSAKDAKLMRQKEDWSLKKYKLL